MSSIVIRRQDTGEEVRRIDTTGKSDAQIDRIEMGLSINFDFDNYMYGEEN